MKKTVLLILFVMVMATLSGADMVKASQILSFNNYQKGFSATFKSTTVIGKNRMVNLMQTYIYGKNARIEAENQTTIVKDGQIYYLNDKKKKYLVMKSGEMGAEEPKTGMPKEDEIYEKAGKEKFAGIECDKYKVVVKDSKINSYYIYVDPSLRMIIGVKINSNGVESVTEISNIKIGAVDKNKFEIPKGYSKAAGIEEIY